jgi:mRNA-degrading endonuclease RelE of RelBE toxin-antitoxin system
MPYRLEFTHDAIRDLQRLRASDAARIAGECQRILSVNPTLTSQARVKHLRGGVFPPYRLRIGDYRVFYDVRENDQVVVVYGVTDKAHAQEWLDQMQRQERHDEDSDS